MSLSKKSCNFFGTCSSEQIEALANMTARFEQYGPRRRDRGTCRDLGAMMKTGACGFGGKARPLPHWERPRKTGSEVSHEPNAVQRLAAQALPSASAFVPKSYSVQISRDGGTDNAAIFDIAPADLAEFHERCDLRPNPARMSAVETPALAFPCGFDDHAAADGELYLAQASILKRTEEDRE
jgi:hypothetical protein